MLNPGYVTFTKNADPFDGSAPARLQRMGLLMPNGKPNVQTMQVFTNIIAGQFFDDLCDYHSDPEHLASTLAGFSELAARRDYKKVYLLHSIRQAPQALTRSCLVACRGHACRRTLLGRPCGTIDPVNV